jgi:flagellar biosynthetic protein FlhB
MSTEFIAGISLAGAFGLYLTVSGPIMSVLGGGVRGGFAGLAALGTADLDIPLAEEVMSSVGEDALVAILIFAGPLFLLSILVGFGQVGFQLAPKAVEMDPSKVDPIKGLGRLFSMRSVVRTGLALLKLAAIGLAISLTAHSQLGELAAIDGVDVGPALLVGNGLFVRCCAAALVAILLIAVIDLAFQRWQHSKDLRMTKQEVKEEMKNVEGDPHIKGRIRQLQREMAGRRMMSEVPDATVVVTNPTHYAVALRYDRDGEDGRAPFVVAKGVDAVAQRIKEVARENGVLCYENVPLARALHAQCEIGDQIPEQLFEAVAGVLAYVYRVQEGQQAVRA